MRSKRGERPTTVYRVTPPEFKLTVITGGLYRVAVLGDEDSVTGGEVVDKTGVGENNKHRARDFLIHPPADAIALSDVVKAVSVLWRYVLNQYILILAIPRRINSYSADNRGDFTTDERPV